MALVSHLPHLIAYTIVGTAADLEEETKDLSGIMMNDNYDSSSYALQVNAGYDFGWWKPSFGTNDYTNDEKTKLEGIADGAQVNVIESVKVS